MQQYFRHTKPDGVVAIHVSNDLPENGLRVWTDDYSNILGVMK